MIVVYILPFLFLLKSTQEICHLCLSVSLFVSFSLLLSLSLSLLSLHPIFSFCLFGTLQKREKKRKRENERTVISERKRWKGGRRGESNRWDTKREKEKEEEEEKEENEGVEGKKAEGRREQDNEGKMMQTKI